MTDNGVHKGYWKDDGKKIELHHEPINESNGALMLGRVLPIAIAGLVIVVGIVSCVLAATAGR